MKRRQIVKWLMMITVAFVAIGVRADIVVHEPSPYVLSHKEWMAEMRPFVQPWIVPCSVLAIFLAVLVLSMRQRRPSYLLWLAWCVPLPFFVPITITYYARLDWLVLPVLGVLVVSWLVPVVFYFCTRKFVKALGCLIVVPFAFILFWYGVGHSYLGSFDAKFKDVSVCYYGGVVEAREGESYEEYLKRANGLEQLRQADRARDNYCEKCGTMLERWYDMERHSACPKCNPEVIKNRYRYENTANKFSTGGDNME